MQQPTKEKMREYISNLQHAVYLAEIRRIDAEQRLEDIKAIMSRPDAAKPEGSQAYWAVVQNAVTHAINVVKEAEAASSANKKSAA